MTKALPKVLLEQIGLEKIVQRLPESYARSIFSSYVASVGVFTLRPRVINELTYHDQRYLYSNGLSAGAVEFYFFLRTLSA